MLTISVYSPTRGSGVAALVYIRGNFIEHTKHMIVFARGQITSKVIHGEDRWLPSRSRVGNNESSEAVTAQRFNRSFFKPCVGYATVAGE
jgi:hypothetical protein